METLTPIEISKVEPNPLEQNVSALKTELQELKESIRILQTQQLAKELNLPEDVVAGSSDIKPVRRMHRGPGSVPLLESEIREAQSKTDSALSAAKYLRVNYITYKKYCLLFGIWKTYKQGRHLGEVNDSEKGKYPISKLLNGEFPDYPVYRLKDKLINGGIKKPECEQCGYKERRLTDGKIPLIINFEDNNHQNHRLENIKILCYNCTFSTGKGYIRRGKKYHVLDDPDRVQGADYYIPSRF